MTRTARIVLSGSRDIPFNLLRLSQKNVRSIKCGVSIELLADDIARRTLLQGLNVRPALDEAGAETGLFEVPAGGRRFRALELLVKQRRFARDGLVPCVVRIVSSGSDPSAEEDSLAENVFREPLHPLDQFRAMQLLVDQGSPVEDIAARFMTTPAVVRQRLRLAAVSPALCRIYAEDGMTLDQLIAFSVCEDHARQEQVWEQLANAWDKTAALIRRRLTEESVRATDRRVKFVGIDSYVAAGGTVMRDLFEEDRGGWLRDVGLLDQLVSEKLGLEGERIGAEGWKWVVVAIDHAYGRAQGMRELDGFDDPISSGEQARLEALEADLGAIEAEHGQSSDVPQEVNERYEAIQREMRAITERPVSYDPGERAIAGAFVSLDSDGTLLVERGFVKPEDEPTMDSGTHGGQHGAGDDQPLIDGACPAVVTIAGANDEVSSEDEEEEGMLKPLPDKLVTELTVHRTLALQDALASNPAVAFVAVLHAMVLSTFHYASRESCVAVTVTHPTFMHQEPGLGESRSARSLEARRKHWKSVLPESDRDLWHFLCAMPADEQASLLAFCVAHGVNAVWEPTGRYDNGRISPHVIERRIAHSHVLARAVGLDMVGAGWKPLVDNYLGRVTKPRIIAAVTEALGADKAGLIDHLKKGDMAREAERLLDGMGWLPEPLWTPVAEEPASASGDEQRGADDLVVLPAFLDGAADQVEARPDGEATDGAGDGYAIAAE